MSRIYTLFEILSKMLEKTKETFGILFTFIIWQINDLVTISLLHIYSASVGICTFKSYTLKKRLFANFLYALYELCIFSMRLALLVANTV